MCLCRRIALQWRAHFLFLFFSRLLVYHGLPNYIWFFFVIFIFAAFGIYVITSASYEHHGRINLFQIYGFRLLLLGWITKQIWYVPAHRSFVIPRGPGRDWNFARTIGVYIAAMLIRSGYYVSLCWKFVCGMRHSTKSIILQFSNR